MKNIEELLTGKVTALLPGDVFEKFTAHSAYAGVSVSKYIRALIHHELGDSTLINDIARNQGWHSRRMLLVASKTHSLRESYERK